MQIMNLIRSSNLKIEAKYLVFCVLAPLILFSCKDADKKQKAEPIAKSAVIAQEDVLKDMLPHFKKSGTLFRKYKKVYARKAAEGEEIITVTNDGVETSNTANEGDYVIKNQTGAQEMYIIGGEKFNKRYRLLGEAEEEFSEYQPIGKVIGLELTPAMLTELGFQSEFVFMAPWGEKMVAKQGDYLVSPPGFEEVYRIARKEFFETYEKDED